MFLHSFAETRSSRSRMPSRIPSYPVTSTPKTVGKKSTASGKSAKKAPGTASKKQPKTPKTPAARSKATAAKSAAKSAAKVKASAKKSAAKKPKTPKVAKTPKTPAASRKTKVAVTKSLLAELDSISPNISGRSTGSATKKTPATRRKSTDVNGQLVSTPARSNRHALASPATNEMLNAEIAGGDAGGWNLFRCSIQ